MADDSSLIKVGPIGSRNGAVWDQKGCNKIVQIFISHDDEINSIQFQYVENGTVLLSERQGSNNGYNFNVVKLNYPVEYITWISGHKNYSNGHICSIKFGTNHGEYGPFGRSSSHDKEFSFSLGDDRQFSGFHGTADVNGLKSIGVYLKPIATLEYSKLGKSVAENKPAKEGECWEVLSGLNEQ